MTPEELYGKLDKCDLIDKVLDCFDLEILEEPMAPEDEFGHLAYNIDCVCFGVDGSGGQFLLLEDGSVGYWGSEGQLGRFAEGIEQCMVLVMGVPDWMELFGDDELFQDEELLDEFVEGCKMDESEQIRLCQAQVADALGLKVPENAKSLLREFYRSATREPVFQGIYTEDDGDTYSVGGSLLECD